MTTLAVYFHSGGVAMWVEDSPGLKDTILNGDFVLSPRDGNEEPRLAYLRNYATLEFHS